MLHNVYAQKQVLLPSSGVARPLAARCGCQICRSSVFGDIEEPIQPYCLHFLALHDAFVSILNAKEQTGTTNFFLFFVVKLELIQSEFAYIYNFRPFAAPGKCRPLRPATPLLPRMTQLQYIEDSESVLDGSRNRLRAVQ